MTVEGAGCGCAGHLILCRRAHCEGGGTIDGPDACTCPMRTTRTGCPRLQIDGIHSGISCCDVVTTVFVCGCLLGKQQTAPVWFRLAVPFYIQTHAIWHIFSAIGCAAIRCSHKRQRGVRLHDTSMCPRRSLRTHSLVVITLDVLFVLLLLLVILRLLGVCRRVPPTRSHRVIIVPSRRLGVTVPGPLACTR
jgi:hypothetical protein